MKKVLFSLIPLLFILSACNNPQYGMNYYLSLPGKSETWELVDYEILLTTEGWKLGNGKLIMKDENEYFTDSFSFTTYADTNGKNHTMQTNSVAGETDIAEQSTGQLEGEEENPITFDDIESIYMIVEWRDTEDNENVQERIELYEKKEKENTFLE